MSKKDRNTYSLEEINKIDLGDRIEVTNRATGVTSVVKTASKAEISAVVAYLIGVNEDKWAGYYEFNYADLYKKLTDDNEATAIRYLCRIRTVFFKKFLEIENELSLLKSIDEIGYFQKEEVEKLVAMGISPIRYNCHAQDYVIYISELIEKHIDNCAKWFPKFVKWEYIRDLFVIPKKKDMKKVYVAEYNKFKAQRLSYPHQQYIHYEPEEEGYILSSDKRFLEKIYRIHGDVFTQSHLLKDATDDTKNTIYGFIQAASSIVFAVDCENSDPYKFYGAFKSLRKEIMSSVKKIMLFDDIHTASGWKMLERFIDVPIEYIEVERINSSKSLVDMEMAVSVTKEAMCNGTDSFILCSSDSDFGGLIRCVQEAKFLVLYEHEKCGSAIKDAWIERGVPHFALDDFSSSNAGELKTEVLLEELRERVKDTYNVFSRTAMELTQDVFQATYAGYNQQEMKEFCEEYVKTLKLCIDEEDGRFFIKTK